MCAVVDVEWLNGQANFKKHLPFLTDLITWWAFLGGESFVLVEETGQRKVYQISRTECRRSVPQYTSTYPEAGYPDSQLSGSAWTFG